MKKLFIISILLLFIYSSNAQDQKRPTPEEHLKKTGEMLKKELSLSDVQLVKVQGVIKKFMEAAQKLHEQNPPPPPPPMDPKVKEQLDKLVAERDAKIKEVLTDGQYQKFVELEKKMHPAHPGDPGMDHHAPPPPPERQ